jgi:hypothetical protein
LKPDTGRLTRLPPEIVASLLEDSRVLFVLRVSRGGEIISVNRNLVRWSGLAEDDLVGRPITGILGSRDGERVQGCLAADSPGLTGSPLLNFVASDSGVRTLRSRILADGEDRIILGEPDVEEDLEISEELLRLNNELSVLSRENSRRSRELEAARASLEATLAELETSHWHIRKIREHLPLCMECGKVKTGETEWATLLDYLRSNSILVSHGYCPTCAGAVMDGEAP